MWVLIDVNVKLVVLKVKIMMKSIAIDFFSIPTCRFRDDHDLPSDQKTAIGAIVIVGAVYVIGVIVFQIWTIIVANRARKEIGLEKHDLKIKKDLIYY